MLKYKKVLALISHKILPEQEQELKNRFEIVEIKFCLKIYNKFGQMFYLMISIILI